MFITKHNKIEFNISDEITPIMSAIRKGIKCLEMAGRLRLSSIYCII